MPETKLYIRVKQALTWLKRNKGILQKDIADKMGMAEASFTRALARVKEKNDEDFVISFHSAVKDFISLDYLLTGRGTLLADHEQPAGAVEVEPAPSQAPSYADRLISSLEDRLREKDRTIRLLEEKIEFLEAMQHLDNGNPLKDYPFPIGAADGERHKPRIK